MGNIDNVVTRISDLDRFKGGDKEILEEFLAMRHKHKELTPGFLGLLYLVFQSYNDVSSLNNSLRKVTGKSLGELI